MKIKMDQQEFELLLNMAFVMDYVINNYSSDQDNETDKYRMFGQKILSWASDFGLENMVELDENDKHYILADNFFKSGETLGYIENFEINTFWEQLIDRLAIRDLFKEYGEKSVEKMDDKEFFLKRDEFRKKYENEFESNGLQNVCITNNSEK